MTTNQAERDKKEAEESMKSLQTTLYAGELSTQENLQHLHPELIKQIVEQVWPIAFASGCSHARRPIKIEKDKPESWPPNLEMVLGFNYKTKSMEFAQMQGSLDWIHSCMKDCTAGPIEITHWLPLSIVEGGVMRIDPENQITEEVNNG